MLQNRGKMACWTRDRPRLLVQEAFNGGDKCLEIVVGPYSLVCFGGGGEEGLNMGKYRGVRRTGEGVCGVSSLRRNAEGTRCAAVAMPDVS